VTSLLLWAVLASTTCEPVTLEVEGLKRLKRSVVEELLPAALPACVSEADIEEIDRRLWTMGLFDQVSVVREGRVLRVTLREKWTLIPAVDVATSRTLVDSFFFASLMELNFLGRAIELGGLAMWSERSPSFEVWASEPVTAARRWSFEGGFGSVGSSILFVDSEHTWNRRWWGGRIGVRPPFWYDSQWRFSMALDVSHERSTGTVPQGVRSEGVNVGLILRASWDGYEWHDVVPHGTRVSFEATPTIFVTARDVTNRHGVSVQVLHATKFGTRTALTINGIAEGAWWGDPNNSLLLGTVSQSRGGVRGLPDNVYRTTAHAFGTVELRRAFELLPTLFLQPAIFVDGGVMARIDSTGAPTAMVPALSGGAGVRIVWTTLAGLVPRIDGGVLLLPQRSWFFTFGLSQYF
jgi:hypothetical protein